MGNRAVQGHPACQRTGEARKRRAVRDLATAKKWGADQIKNGWLINNATIWGDDHLGGKWHSNVIRNGSVRWEKGRF